MEILQGSDKEPSNVCSLGVIVYGYDGLPMHPVAPPSPDYVPGPEHLPSPDYVPALSPRYAAESDLEEDLEEDPEEDHANYPANGGDGDDESFDDDDDADDEDEKASKDEDDNDEDEHLALADSSAVPVVDPIPSARDTKTFKTDEFAPTPPSPTSPQIVVPLSQT
ncbi:hypothetical protein Tco_1434768 [Tanacetum coccineum]